MKPPSLRRDKQLVGCVTAGYYRTEAGFHFDEIEVKGMLDHPFQFKCYTLKVTRIAGCRGPAPRGYRLLGPLWLGVETEILT